VPYTKVFKEIPAAMRGVEQEYGTCMLASGIWFPWIATEPVDDPLRHLFTEMLRLLCTLALV
jgi:hypothetical protein